MILLLFLKTIFLLCRTKRKKFFVVFLIFALYKKTRIM
ncbi:hypothetical protein TGS27_0327 [Geobacillus stearothermophilus]|uniref:Uncharacterized protein n=1 Tax=Geobacillus stearothermophilus TaxID=1422 RepID=A0A150NBS4_GEOSE|nr:hypothetical protein B4114_0787 [Geobacillus stearothermophilus]OAO87845.1 hypothetical protein TGS27_0327 [Geobacillus stearothermophilus]